MLAQASDSCRSILLTLTPSSWPSIPQRLACASLPSAQSKDCTGVSDRSFGRSILLNAGGILVMQAMTHYDWDTRVGSEEIEFRYTMRSMQPIQALSATVVLSCKLTPMVGIHGRFRVSRARRSSSIAKEPKPCTITTPIRTVLEPFAPSVEDQPTRSPSARDSALLSGRQNSR